MTNEEFNKTVDDFFKYSNIERKKKYTPAVQEVKDLLEDGIVDDCPKCALFDIGERIAALRTAIVENPEELCEMLKTLNDKIRDKLIDADFCPDCGAELEVVEDEQNDTYVPWGSTYVLESKGYYLQCPNCRYKKED